MVYNDDCGPFRAIISKQRKNEWKKNTRDARCFTMTMVSSETQYHTDKNKKKMKIHPTQKVDRRLLVLSFKNILTIFALFPPDLHLTTDEMLAAVTGWLCKNGGTWREPASLRT